MDHQRYQQYLSEYVNEARQQSDGSVSGVAEYLHTLTVRGLFVTHRQEKERALQDARQAFDDHRHWPLEIILSRLGLKPE